jgi:hypothetical protein
MDEREQLETQWASLSVAQRQALFRGWVLGATGEAAPAEITMSDDLGSDLVAYQFADDLSAWQVAVAASVFAQASPGQALGVGDAVIEISRLFAEEQDEGDEQAEFEEEDESVEGQEAAHDAAIEAAIDELEAERSNLESMLPGAGDDAAALESLIDFLDDLIDGLQARLGEQEAST